MYSPQTGDNNYNNKQKVENIIQDIFKNKKKNNIDGLTFSVGEPFNQAKALVKICEGIKEENISIITFTGYTIENILKIGDKKSLKLFELTNLLIDSPFIKNKKIFNNPWIGSSNQKYHFLSGYYNLNDIKNNSNKIEIRLDETGKITIYGITKEKDIEKLLSDIK